MNKQTSADKNFIQSLESSIDAVFIVGRYFNSLGYDIQINATKTADLYEDRKGLADDGDLRADKGNRSLLVEVKAREYDFTQRGDFPFDTIIVDNKDRFDQKKTTPNYYFSVSKDRKYIAVVDVQKTRKHWTVAKKKCRPYNIEKSYYIVRVEKVAFTKL